MSTARGRSTLALLVVAALMALLAVPVLAFADETDPAAIAATESVPQVAPVEVAPVEEAMPSEEASDPVPEIAPDVVPEPVLEADLVTVAPTTAAAPSRTSFTAARGSLGLQKSSRWGSPAKRSAPKVLLADPQINCSEEALLSQWSLVPSRVYENGQTTFTWTLQYTPTAADDGDEKCGGEGISHITITVCLAADAVSGRGGLVNGTTYTYKWDAQEPVHGDSFSLIYDGDIPGGGSAVPVYKKAGTLMGAASSGPDCSTSEPDCPNGYTLQTIASPANAGSISGAGDNPHAEGSQVELTATPGTGFLFTGWSGDGTGTATRTVSFTGEDCELVVTASFAPEQTPDCSGDFDPTNNGPNGDCTIPPTPDCSGDFDPTNNGPNGDCTEPPPTAVDLCPNLEGDQDQIPDGMELNEDGDCVEPVVLPVDVCPNLDGDQAEVPEDMTVNPVTGDCEEDEVLGEIIDRDEDPSTPSDPTGRVAPQVQPSRVAAEAGVLPLTGRDLVPFLMASLLLILIGAGLTIVRRPAAKK